MHRLLSITTVCSAILIVAVVAAFAAQEPPKVPNPHGKFKEDCSLCHRADGWKPARISKDFNHEKFGVPLTGAHASVPCMSCHTSLDFAMAPTGCVDCHSDVHNGELGTDCSRCHGTRSFVDRNDQIRLHRLTRFPLAGAHVTLDCEMCHRFAAPGALSWVNTPTDCQSCHIDQYMAVKNPDHVGAGFSKDCAMCHNEQTWLHVRFDHNDTSFPLTGAHVSVACTSCHIGGVYSGTPTACVSCHQNDYDATNDPSHAAAGFSTTCTECHNTKSWGGAQFDHASFFPIYTGVHRGKWTQCTECHTSAVSYAEFSCIDCHAHSNKSETDNNHNGVNGYAYNSQACYTCHPQGRN